MSARVPNVFEKNNLVDDAVTLFVDKVIYEGWEDVKITRELNSAASDFTLQLTDKWRAEQEPWRVQPGQALHIHIGKKSILTGYVDKMEVSISKDARDVTITGRSKTGDLVDCSVTGEQAFSNINLADLAKKLCSPFGISVVMKSDSGAAFESVVVQTGETVFSLLDRIARQRKLLMYPSYDGNLVFEQRGTTKTKVEIRQGVNLLSGSGKFDNSNRYSQYSVVGQNIPWLSSAEKSVTPNGTATDAGITRFRPYILSAEATVDDGTSGDRAGYEAEIRAAKAMEVQVQVQGWYQAPNEPWEINQLVFADIGFLGVRREMLIKKVEFNKGNGGTTTTLSLIRKDAYGFKRAVKKEDPLGWVKFAK